MLLTLLNLFLRCYVMHLQPRSRLLNLLTQEKRKWDGFWHDRTNRRSAPPPRCSSPTNTLEQREKVFVIYRL